jgi:predicted DNA-binding transcriptional regulator AlpA
MLIARQVAREVGAALVGELRTLATPVPPALPELLTVPDVARLVKVEAKTVRPWRTDGLLPEAICIGGVLRWRREAIEAWLQEREGAR